MTSETRRRRVYLTIRERRCRSVRFEEICNLLERYEWILHAVAGSHHIFKHKDYQGIVVIPRPHHGRHVGRRYCEQALEAIRELMGYDE